MAITNAQLCMHRNRSQKNLLEVFKPCAHKTEQKKCKKLMPWAVVLMSDSKE